MQKFCQMMLQHVWLAIVYLKLHMDEDLVAKPNKVSGIHTLYTQLGHGIIHLFVAKLGGGNLNLQYNMQIKI